MDYKGEWGGGGPGHSGGPLNDSGGGGDFESEDKYAVCFLDFFDKTIITKQLKSIYFS